MCSLSALSNLGRCLDFPLFIVFERPSYFLIVASLFDFFDTFGLDDSGSFGVILLRINFATLPILKKQLKAKQRDIDNTRIFVTFTEEEVIYQNLTVKPEDVVKVETPVEEKEAHVIDDEVVEESPVEEVVAEEAVAEESPVEEAVAKEEIVEETEEDITVECDEEKTFRLDYKNFMAVRETENLILFYLDKRTVVILPKSTLLGKKSVVEFKEFVKTKINRSRIKFSK